jgi:hypothetical protein
MVSQDTAFQLLIHLTLAALSFPVLHFLQFELEVG